MAFYANDVHPIPPDHAAPDCDDQLPLISRVGRGLKGDSAMIRISDPDTENETHLEGLTYDNASKTYKTDWVSENINGGQLLYQYNLRPYTIPRTFTITFMYRRPGRKEWSWTTPAIPYIWTLDDAGKPEEFPDHIVGSGVATLFIKTVHDTEWNERLKYPDGTTRDDFNAPLPDEAWAATITFGKGGDIEVPDFDDIAKIIGISKEDIYNILEDNSVTINGIDAKNLIEYIDKCDKRDLDHLHGDLGFNTTGHDPEGSFGGYNTVKEYIDSKLSQIVGGPGVIVQPGPNGTVIIMNPELSGAWERVDPNDVDFQWYNGWHRKYTHDQMDIWIIPSKNPEGEIVSATMKIDWTADGETDDLTRDGNLLDPNSFEFRHWRPMHANDLSAMFSFSFKPTSKWAGLNNMNIVSKAYVPVGIWNVEGLKNGTWKNVGANWDVTCTITKSKSLGYKDFTVDATSIADGYNSSYRSPGYDCSELRMNTANFGMQVTLG